MNHSNTKRPLIGLVSSRDGGKMMMNLTYMNSVWYAGGLPVVLAYTTDADKLAEYAETFDGFLFSGGVDVDPVKYGEEKMFDSVEIDAVRDEFEEALFKAVYPTGKPILGICRGVQVMNVAMGGTLHIDLPDAGKLCHSLTMYPRHMVTHEITVVKDSRLAKAMQGANMVNSFHHQAVDKAAPCFAVTARSLPDGVIEAIKAL